MNEESKKYMDDVMVDKAIGMANSSRANTSSKAKPKVKKKTYRVCKSSNKSFEKEVRDMKDFIGLFNQVLLMILLFMLIKIFS
ncbi:MAG: hypothetical protein SPI59_03150 [Finegoldia sp.]|nr:hypothetical protein [Finegoldia sp.]